MRDESRMIAEEFAGLDAEDRRRFLSKLRENELSFAELPIVPVSRRHGLPLSYAQARLWFLWRLDEKSTAYHMSNAFELTGPLDEPAIRDSFTALVSRHESLRTVFRSRADGTVVQEVVTADSINYSYIDLSATPAELRDSQALEAAQRIARNPFDLDAGPAFRAGLLRLADHQHILVVAMHHIVSDGWSMQVVVNDFVEIYRAKREQREPRLGSLPIQYADYAIWQRNWLEAGEADRQLQYWKAALGMEQPVLPLPTDYPRDALARNRADRYTLELAPWLTHGLRRRAQQHRTTLFTALLAGFQALLYRYTGQRDIRIGVTNANRNRDETRGVAGLFVNTQVMRGEVRGLMTLSALLDQAQRTMAAAQEHQDLPFEQLVDALQAHRDLEHAPLFQVMMNHQRMSATGPSSLPGLTLQSYELGEQAARFDLVLNVTEIPSGDIVISFTYAGRLFAAQTIQRLAHQYVKVLQAIADNTRLEVCQVLLSESAAHPVPHVPQLEFEPVHVSFARRARQCRAAPALHCDGSVLSYDDLDRWSDRIALGLLALGLDTEARIGLCVERSAGLVAGLLGILKSGAAFVPLDPAYPADRLAYMMEDSAIQAVVTDAVSAELCASVLIGHSQVRVDAVPDHQALPPVPIHPRQLAYVIYTSGSTGRPKGVAISHHSLFLHLQDFIGCYGIAESDRLLQSSTINFDVALHELFPALLQGGQVHMRGPQPWDLQSLSRALSAGEVTFARIPTAFWQQWLHVLPRELPHLRQVTVGGEGLPGDALARWMEGPLSHIPVDNLYGPTETTVACLAHRCSAEDSRFHTVAIGTPYASRRVFVMDADGNEAPAGGFGELCIAGETLARGYLGRPGLTAERFVADPAGGGGRLYRSGDSCRQRADGVVEFLGRLDQQIKLRGHRIELGEVEAALRRCPGVTEAVVDVRGEGERRRLVGYVTGTAQPTDLRALLQETLPDYMVPSAILMLETLPLNVNGKVDRKALPEPEYGGAQQYEAPQAGVEQILASIWRSLLSLERLGRHDNFFEVGGDSILSLQIVARAHSAGWKITPRQMFERQTLAQLATVAVALSVQPTEPAEELSGDIPLLPVQSWFFEQPIPHRHHWNQSVLLLARQSLDQALLMQALQTVMGWHDVLRFRYAQDAEGQWRQSVAAAGLDELPLWIRDVADADEITALSADAQRSLNLSEGPLWRAVWMRVADGSQRLLLVIHHLVVDGVSWRVLLQQLEQAYRDRQAVQPVPGTSYQRWAQWIQGYPLEHQDELAYWQRLVGVAAAVPCDYPQGDRTLSGQSSVTLELSRTRTSALLKEVPAAYRTQMNDVLLTALGRALSQWTGLSSILIDLEAHGREDLSERMDLSRTSGWFTTLYPVALDTRGTPGEALKRVKQMLRDVPNRGLGHGAFKYLGTGEQRATLARVSAAQVSFNYLGQFDASFDEHAPWQPAPESCGAARDPAAPRSHELAIVGQVYDRQLRLSIQYSQPRYRRERMELLATLYQQELEALITHCISGVSGVTPADFPHAKLTQAQLDALPVNAAQIADLYPMTPMQQGMVLHTLRNPGSGMYLMQSRFEFNSAINLAAFQNAWTRVVERHSVLRTAYLWTPDGLLLQLVVRQARSPVEYMDWHDLSREEAATRTERLLREELETGFDLSDPPLLRIRLIRLGEQRFQMIQSFHHILMDAWCRSLLLTDFFAYYNGYCNVVSVERPPPRPYRDYVAWLGRQDLQLARQFWRDALAGFDAATPLPMKESDAGDPDVSTMVDVCLELSEAATNRLQTFAQRNHITVNTVAQAAWALLLSRYANQKDILFGVTVAGRPTELQGIQDTVGLFIQTIPLRVSLAGAHHGLTVLAWLQQLLAQNAQIRQNEHLPLAEIQMLSEVPRGQDLFKSLFVFENAPFDPALRGQARELSAAAGASRTHTNYPLTVVVMPGSRLTLQLTYERSLFDHGVVEGMARHFRTLIEQCMEHPDAQLHQLQMLTGTELEHLAVGGSGPEDRRGLDAPFVRLFEAEVERQPQRLAVRLGSHSFTYDELNRRANRIGHALLDRDVRPDEVIAIYAERSPEMLSAVLGAFKAGCAYLALDPKLPVKRLATTLELSGSHWILTTEECAEGLHAALVTLAKPPQVLIVEEMLAAAGSDVNPDIEVYADNAAYVIFTSGSTGEPKGVVITGRGMLNNHWSKIRLLPITQSDVVAQTASQSFDICVWQLLGGLLCGATIEIVPDSVANDPEALLRHAGASGITVLESVPSLIQGMMDAEPLPVPALRWMLPTGEALQVELARRWFERYPDIPMMNAYGPAECADDVALYVLRSAVGERGAGVAIGKVVDNMRFHVLDTELRPMPAGVPGELYVGGVGVGRGYLRRPGLTAERFVPDPFASVPGSRIYRTGDLVRQRTDGMFDYVGRLDQQLKIRGFRVELGEIESHLARAPEITDGAVGVHDDTLGGRRLVAYVVPRNSQLLHADGDVLREFRESLRHSLLGSLPEYMVPGVWVLLDRLPRTPNGKLDRKRLPQPDLTLFQKVYEAPRGPVEVNLAGIWSDLLGVERIGRNDNFFELGGHSLLALTLLARMRQRGLHAQVRNLFQQPQFADFARTVERARPATRDSMLPLIELDAGELQCIEAAVPGGAANIKDIYPLAPLQEGILFHHVLETGGDTYVTPHLLSFESEARLRQFVDSFRQVIARHDILRTAVLWEGLRQPVQVVYREVTLSLDVLEEGEPVSVQERLWNDGLPGRCRIDVRSAPMIRTVAAHDEPNDRWLLLLASHHLINDHSTLDFIVDEITLIQQGRGDELPEPVPFRNFVAQARTGLSQSEHEAFFKGMLGDVEETTAPFGLLDVRGDGRAIEEATLPLNGDLSARLRAVARRYGVSAATLIHLAWAILVGKTAGTDDVTFGTVLFGRMEAGEGADRGLGLFINTLPLRIRLGSVSVEQCLRNVHDLLSELLHHEHASLSLAQRCSGLPAGAPVFCALLNYRYSIRPKGQEGARAWEGIQLLAAEERTNYPITLSVDDRGQEFDLVAQVVPSVGAQRLCDYLHNAIAGLVTALEHHPRRLVCELDVASQLESTRLQQWATGPHRYEYREPVHRLFERRVRESPAATALIFVEQTLSYDGLNRRANRLAHRLIALGVKPDTPVAILAERSLQMVVGLMAILKAGGAYVPLDPEYPGERLRYMVEDSSIEMLLTHRFAQERAPSWEGVRVLDMDNLDLTQESEDNPAVDLHAESLAYVIYTSGSTGKPKGAANRHGSLSNRLQWMQNAYQLTPLDVVLQKTPFSFDVSVWEFFWPLMQGARLVLMEPREHRDPQSLVDVICGEGVTTVHFVPSMLGAFLDCEDASACASLRRIVCSGEALSIEARSRVFERLPLVELYNLYGPTEAAIDVTHWSCIDEHPGSVPIGRPIAGTRSVVLDAALHPVPQGVAGELYLGGVGLARGYLHRPALTASRFVADPFSDCGERLYRTGDLVRWSADGQLEYLGRIDQQVKIRGLRIELGEIESQLLAWPQVREAAVAAQDGARLVAYVTGHAGAEIDTTALRGRLSEVLPQYMVPGAIVVLEQLPLNANGKLDRKALPAFAHTEERGYEAPLGDLEEIVAAIWSEVLDVERVGRHDNFFELGGHSLALVRVQTLVEARTSVHLPLRAYLECGSVRDTAQAVERARGQEVEQLDEIAALLAELEG